MKTTLTSLIIIFSVLLSTAQIKLNKETEEPNKPICFDKKSQVINFGICMPLINGYGSKNISAMNVQGINITGNSQAYNLSYEKCTPKRVGPGYLGIGGFAGYQNTHFKINDYNGSNFYCNYNNNFYTLAIRAAYHWDILNSKKAEVYVGVMAGLGINDMSIDTNDPDLIATNYHLHVIIPQRYQSIFAGARWYFVKNVALFGEMGFRNNFISGGINVKF